ncbi:MAG: hypothetical protein V4671_13450, partial [Armatimonadota bacterium]
MPGLVGLRPGTPPGRDAFGYIIGPVKQNPPLRRGHFALTPPFMGEGGPESRAPEGSLAQSADQAG